MLNARDLSLLALHARVVVAPVKSDWQCDQCDLSSRSVQVDDELDREIVVDN
jgi:hypothetical protein